LRMQRVEVLLQPLFCGFAGIDRAAAHGAQIPKKRGPDQRAPVMIRATSDSER
jgi:hypothetical protein